MSGKPIGQAFYKSGYWLVETGAGAGELAQDVKPVAAEAGSAVAVVFTGDRLQFLLGQRAHAQAAGVGQADQGHELTQLVAAAQVDGFQVKAAPFQVLEAL
ncbi:MAG: hypothetical protein EOO60_03905, partial [Hymenobacter sp.]